MLSAIISAVEIGSNFGDKIARFYRIIKSRDKIIRLTSAYEGKTQAWRKVMTAYHQGMTYSHLRADYMHTGISSGPNAR